MNEIEKFVKERDAVLMTRDVEQFRKFVMNCNLYDTFHKEAFSKMPNQQIEIIMHKMIVHCINIPLEVRQESKNWLEDRGYSAEIYMGD